MTSVNPILFGAACALGVLLSNLYSTGGNLTGSLLSGAATGVIVALVLFVWKKRRT